MNNNLAILKQLIAEIRRRRSHRVSRRSVVVSRTRSRPVLLLAVDRAEKCRRETRPHRVAAHLAR